MNLNINLSKNNNYNNNPTFKNLNDLIKSNNNFEPVKPNFELSEKIFESKNMNNNTITNSRMEVDEGINKENIKMKIGNEIKMAQNNLLNIKNDKNKPIMIKEKIKEKEKDKEYNLNELLEKENEEDNPLENYSKNNNEKESNKIEKTKTKKK